MTSAFRGNTIAPGLLDWLAVRFVTAAVKQNRGM
jgi:hypothetical protein